MSATHFITLHPSVWKTDDHVWTERSSFPQLLFTSESNGSFPPWGSLVITEILMRHWLWVQRFQLHSCRRTAPTETGIEIRVCETYYLNPSIRHQDLLFLSGDLSFKIISFSFLPSFTAFFSSSFNFCLPYAFGFWPSLTFQAFYCFVFSFLLPSSFLEWGTKKRHVT